MSALSKDFYINNIIIIIAYDQWTFYLKIEPI